MKKQSENNNVNLQFKEMIKGIINEENYFKEKNIKILMKDIMKEIDPLIASYVKKHFMEIAHFILITQKQNNNDIFWDDDKKSDDCLSEKSESEVDKKDAKTS